jgi:hypothetical protein
VLVGRKINWNTSRPFHFLFTKCTRPWVEASSYGVLMGWKYLQWRRALTKLPHFECRLASFSVAIYVHRPAAFSTAFLRICMHARGLCAGAALFPSNTSREYSKWACVRVCVSPLSHLRMYVCVCAAAMYMRHGIFASHFCQCRGGRVSFQVFRSSSRFSFCASLSLNEIHKEQQPTPWARIYSVWCASRQKELHRCFAPEPFAWVMDAF